MAFLMGGDVRSRVVLELLIGCRRFGQLSEGGYCMLNLHEDEIASRAGLTRETVSRQLNKLKAEGFVKVTHNGIQVFNINVLEKSLKF